jgi:DNA-binding transcriptional regulator YiaG
METTAVRVARIRRLAHTGEARAIRRAARLPLRIVALEVGCAPSTVMRWESGERRPTGPKALRYLDLLDKLLREAV